LALAAIPLRKEQIPMRHKRFRKRAAAGACGALFFVAILAGGPSSRAGNRRRLEKQPQAQEQAPAEQEQLAARDDTRPAEQVYKNIQVLKGVPADKLLQTMKYFTRALGVRCEHCHVTAPGSQIPGFGAFSKDDIEAKQTARKMIQMAGAIGRDFFPGKAGPTCWTCHRGNVKPEIEPPPPPTAPAK
jgi:hypothetical protein